MRLVAGVLAEEPWAQAALFDQYAALVRRVLRRVLGPGAHVDDAQQDVFLAFFRSVRNLEDPSVLRSYLIGISLRVASSELRRRRLRSWLMLSPEGVVPDEPRAGDVDGENASRSALRRLYAILDDLDVSSRMVFVLRHIEELSLNEVAQAMGISLATTKRKLSKSDAVVLKRVERDPELMHYVLEAASKSSGSLSVDDRQLAGQHS